MDTSLESPNIENLSVVREFADVFPDELPGLPPAREIKFGIELIPGAELSQRLHIVWNQLYFERVKEQLQEMLENGFIRPSVSLWGAPVLFVKKKDGSMRLCIDLPRTQPITIRTANPLRESRFLRVREQDISKNAFRRVMALEFLVIALVWTKLCCVSGFDELTEEVVCEVFEVRVLLSSRFPWVICIGPDGIIMDPSKVEAITNCLRTTTVTEVEKESYEELKRRLVSAPILTLHQVPMVSDMQILHDLERLDVELCVRGSDGYWASMRIESNLMLQIKEAQRDDGELWAIVQNVEDGKHTEFRVDDGGVVWFEDRLCSTKMYRDLKQYFWWNGMKQDVATRWRFLCGNGMRFPWHFVTGLPTTQKRNDAIWVVADRLTKSVISYHPEEYCTFELMYGRTVVTIYWDEVDVSLIDRSGALEITNEKVAWASLSPRFIGPFEILERIGEVSYRLALPPQLSHVHDVFHVSLLRGYHYHPLHVASYPFDQIQPDMSLSEEPESILDRQERVMRNKVIPFVKILWKNHPEREATWRTKRSMRSSYPPFLCLVRKIVGINYTWEFFGMIIGDLMVITEGVGNSKIEGKREEKWLK
ncbi:hypothetical protein Tco_1383844 [Tanacetum coccineum]